MPEQGSHVADRLHTTGLTEKPKKNFSGINYLSLFDGSKLLHRSEHARAACKSLIQETNRKKLKESETKHLH